MSKKTVEYTQGPQIKGKRVQDFLPSPAQLKLKQPDKKITIGLPPESLALVEAQAAKINVPVTQILRSVLQAYTEGLR